METIIIIGPQGSGKSTLAKYLIPNPTLTNDQSARYGELGLIADLQARLDDPKKQPHTLFIDEADVFFSMLETSERRSYRNYWALARHRGLTLAVFVARRYVQIPVFVRASANQIFVSADIRAGRELTTLEAEGIEVFRGLPRGEYLFYRGL